VTSHHLFLLAGLLAFYTPATAQVIQTEDGPVQFFGLETWTPEMIRDSLAEYSPGSSLSDGGACMVVLKKNLGFPEAGVSVYQYDGPEVPEGSLPWYMMITVVEPADADRIEYAPMPDDIRPPRPEWEELHAFRREHRKAFHLGTQWYAQITYRKDRLPRNLAGHPDSAAMADLWALLGDHDTEADREAALWTVGHDASPDNRAIATALLLNFPEADSTWWALAELARAPDDPVTGASPALYSLAVHAPRAVDWRPAVPALRALLGGTNIPALTHVTGALTLTEVSPELAKELLADRADLLLAYLDSLERIVRRAPRNLLVQLSGRDLGDDAAAWREWIDSL
jgi:hypothetical protein